MQNVIFLDFDGPLFPDRIIRFHPDNKHPYPGKLKVNSPLVAGNLTYWRMDPVSVGILNNLYAIHPFEIVVSSSWNRFCELDFIEELFHINGIDIPFHQDWCPSRIGVRAARLREIQCWLEDHPEVLNSIIIDDPWSGPCVDAFEQQYDSYPEDIKNRIPKENIIIVDPTLGLDISHHYKMIKIVERWSGVTKEQQDEEKAKRDMFLRAMIW